MFARKRHRLVNAKLGILAVLFLCGIIWISNSSVDFNAPCTQMANYNVNRTELYEKMDAESRTAGPAFLTSGATSQSLKMSDIFSFEDGKIVPVLKPADPPVRAAVLHLPPKYAEVITAKVKDTLGSHFPGIWYQNRELYHFSLFHASHHLEPVPASEHEIQHEIKAVEKVAKACCPLDVTLERITLTSTGVLIGCWQVSKGTDPFTMRASLKEHLPNAPKTQLYDPLLLHTSFARLLPNTPLKAGPEITTSQLEKLVQSLNQQLHNFQAKINELWFVEELDVLALGLDGRMKVHKFNMNNICKITHINN